MNVQKSYRKRAKIVALPQSFLGAHTMSKINFNQIWTNQNHFPDLTIGTSSAWNLRLVEHMWFVEHSVGGCKDNGFLPLNAPQAITLVITTATSVLAHQHDGFTLRNPFFHGNFTRQTKEQTGCWRRSRFPRPPVRHLRHYLVSRLSCSYPAEQANESPAHLFRFPVVVTVCFPSVFLV